MPIETFYLPTRITLGVGCFERLGQVAAGYGRRALLVTGRRAMRAAGITARAMALLEAAGVVPILYEGAGAEPTLAMVEEAMALAREEACDMAIGLGGGSAIDVAKAAAGLLPLPGSPAEYHAGRKLEGPGLPFLAVPTTAGTGAEVTHNAVLIDPQGGGKKSIRSEYWYARAALVDPELTLSAPPAVTASAGGDALCQAIEAYVSIGAMPITDALSEEAVRRIGRSLLRAYHYGDDLEARADMLYGSLLAGMALTNARLGAVHGLAHPLGYRYRIPHGVVCTLLLPHVIRYNIPVAAAKYARVAQLLGARTAGLSEPEAAAMAAAKVQELAEQMGMPLRLRDLGAQEADFEAIIAEALPSGSMKANPRPMSAEDVRAVLQMAM